MGYLLHIFVAICIQGVVEADLTEPLLTPLWGFVALPLPYLLTLGVRRAALCGRFRLGERLLRLLHLWGPLAYGWAGIACGQVALFSDWLGGPASSAWPDWTMVVGIVPFALWQLQGIDAHSRAISQIPRDIKRHRIFQIRMFGAALMPVLLYISVCAAVGWSESTRVHIERIGLLNALFFLALLMTLALLLPGVLARTWKTESIPPGSLREMMDSIVRLAGYRVRDLRIWHTGHSMTNAVIIGMHPSSRMVLFSDSLLTMLSPRELAAVVGHELGHAVRRHLSIFLAWSLVFLMAADWVDSKLGIEDEWLAAVSLLSAVVIWLFSFGWLSRRYELDADLYSIALIGDGPAMISALERLGGRLRDVAGWRHFSIGTRIRFLHRAMNDPDFASAFRRRWQRVGQLGFVLALSVGSWKLWTLAEDWHEDRIVVELCLGRYQDAVERAAGVKLEEGLSHLVQVARDWPALEAAAAGVVTQATLVSALRGQIDAALLI
ncbi:MAG: Zn-dependent protease with chaperone function, partial [Planctomycetota bacterium]